MIDPAEMSRVFGSPKKIQKKSNTVNNSHLTLENAIAIFEQQIEYERKFRIQAEKQLDEYKVKLEKSEKRFDEILQQMNNLTDTVKLLQAPTPKRKKFFGIF